MKYGIANSTGGPSESRASRVIEAALDCGIRFFDTAQAYGESEFFLGAAIRRLGAANRVHVISKLDPALSPSDSQALLRSVEASAERLGGPLWAMLLHRPAWLGVWDEGLGAALREAQQQGLVKYLGASVDTVEEARKALAHQAMEIVQLPANAWDQRMLRAGIFRIATAQEKLCFVRSIFLQGVLTLPAEMVASRLELAYRASEQWESVTQKCASSAEALAVRSVLSLPAAIVVGMETADQVRVNARLFKSAPLSDAELDSIHQEMSGVLDDRILNPSTWQEQE
jgi:aryl-alcohol dehydrogenase-like predicted oxidoreductase